MRKFMNSATALFRVFHPINLTHVMHSGSYPHPTGGEMLTLF